jgi:hypothetical protein
MNQTQRDFLIKKIEKTYNDQVEQINSEEATAPSLNNYLIAAFLNGTIRYKNLDLLKEKLHNRVLKMGIKGVLINEDDEDDWRSTRRRRSSERKYMEIDPEDLFEIPQAYLDELELYRAKKRDIAKRLKELEAQKETIIMKLQIGSAKILDKFVEQVDNLIDIETLNRSLLIGSGEEGDKTK